MYVKKDFIKNIFVNDVCRFYSQFCLLCFIGYIVFKNSNIRTNYFCTILFEGKIDNLWQEKYLQVVYNLLIFWIQTMWLAKNNNFHKVILEVLVWYIALFSFSDGRGIVLFPLRVCVELPFKNKRVGSLRVVIDLAIYRTTAFMNVGVGFPRMEKPDFIFKSDHVKGFNI